MLSDLRRGWSVANQPLGGSTLVWPGPPRRTNGTPAAGEAPARSNRSSARRVASPQRSVEVLGDRWRNPGSLGGVGGFASRIGRIGELTAGEEAEGESELLGLVLRDRWRQDPLAERPGHDLGAVLVAPPVPGIARGVPRGEVAKPEEGGLPRRCEVLVEPDVSQLVEECPARGSVDETRAQIDPSIDGVSEGTVAARKVVVEVDLHLGHAELRDLESASRPSRHLDLLG